MTRKVFETILASLGAINCLSVAILTWISIAGYQPMWPFPALVLIETALLGIAGLITNIRTTRRNQIVRWIVPGCLMTTVILGAWSIGFLLLPAALIFFIRALTPMKDTYLRGHEELLAFFTGSLGNLLFLLGGRLF